MSTPLDFLLENGNLFNMINYALWVSNDDWLERLESGLSAVYTDDARTNDLMTILWSSYSIKESVDTMHELVKSVYLYTEGTSKMLEIYRPSLTEILPLLVTMLQENRFASLTLGGHSFVLLINSNHSVDVIQTYPGKFGPRKSSYSSVEDIVAVIASAYSDQDSTIQEAALRTLFGVRSIKVPDEPAITLRIAPLKEATWSLLDTYLEQGLTQLKKCGYHHLAKQVVDVRKKMPY